LIRRASIKSLYNRNLGHSIGKTVVLFKGKLNLTPKEERLIILGLMDEIPDGDDELEDWYP
jgi:hypothetical protein